MPCLGLGVGAWVVVLVGLGHVGQVPGTWASENPCGPLSSAFPWGTFPPTNLLVLPSAGGRG